MERYEEIERALIKDYRKKIWRPFLSALKDYDLVKDGDRIAVCISGGKDSMLLAKCMQELKRHSPTDFELTFLVMDPGYTDRNLQRIKDNAALLNIPIEIFTTDIFSAVVEMGGSPCYMCAKMRRGYLYREAQRRGCNKIALGHHYDDVIETTLMSLIYGGQIQSMPPKLHSDNVPGMELIRPLYKVREEQIIRWRDDNELEFLQCACKFTEERYIRDDGRSNSKRLEMKGLVKYLTMLNPTADRCIFRATHNVSLDTMVRWKHHGVEHTFLEEYDDGAYRSDE
ncbi:MAG: tRNA 2-thiocytidine biosynthesis protein TtcA [Clostridia bacterium]|nr:tRNA 2-thiocytidine biosynthesis protein TtcA [Clostridia bacterium]